MIEGVFYGGANPCRSAGGSPVDAAWGSQAPVERLADSEFDLFRLGPVLECIDQRALRRRHVDPCDLSNLRCVERALKGMHSDPGAWTKPTLGPGHRQVDSGGYDVRNAIEVECACMRHDRTGTSEWQPRSDNVLMRTGWEVPKPVQAPLNALESPSRLRVVAKRSSIHPGLHCLCGREVPRLALSDPVQMFVDVRHMGDSLPQTPDMAGADAPQKAGGCPEPHRFGSDEALRSPGQICWRIRC